MPAADERPVAKVILCFRLHRRARESAPAASISDSQSVVDRRETMISPLVGDHLQGREEEEDKDTVVKASDAICKSHLVHQ
jgi:hypothetical protein